MSSAISISALNKIYGNGFKALAGIDLEIRRSEIFALLGPNGAGKTTLINAVCGIVQPTSGRILVCGHDNKTDPAYHRASASLRRR
jgi:ABC-2 type transport system ATP-binding protein